MWKLIGNVLAGICAIVIAAFLYVMVTTCRILIDLGERRELSLLKAENWRLKQERHRLAGDYLQRYLDRWGLCEPVDDSYKPSFLHQHFDGTPGLFDQ
jgi:hypothetical protein